jgi:predicted PurR-regulated permease PerM
MNTAARVPATEPRQRELAVFISIRTILLAGVAVALAWALASIGEVLLLVFVSVFSAAVLAPVVDAMSRRLPWSRGACSSVLVLGIVFVTIGFLAIALAPLVSDVRQLADNLPDVIRDARHSDIGRSLGGGGGGGLETLQKHAGDIVSGAGRVSGGLAHVGVSAFGALTLAVSVIFMTLFLLTDLPRLRSSIGGLMYPGTRRRYDQITDRIIVTTSRYMLGNLAISAICAVTYGVTAAILGIPYALALALLGGLLDMIPNIGALLAGIVIGLVALSVGVGALIVVLVVIVVYQQVENYVLQPMIIGRATDISGFTVILSVLVFGSLFGVIGAVIGVPIAAAIKIVFDEATAARRARIAAIAVSAA